MRQPNPGPIDGQAERYRTGVLKSNNNTQIRKKMKTVEINVYSFEELSETAKNNVREWVNRYGYAWAEEAHASLRGLEELFPGLKIKSSDFSTWADVNYSTGQIDDSLLNLSGTRLRTWLINNIYDYLWERQPQGQYTKNPDTKKWAYKRRSRIFYVETSCPYTGYCIDDDILQPIRDFIKNPAQNVNMSDLIGQCISAWEKSAQSDCRYQETDEYILETCEANDYQFTADGKIF